MIDYFSDLQITVAQALAEDVRSGDITAQIIDKSTKALAHVIAREDALICGRPWVDEVAKQVDDALRLEWNLNDGDQVRAGEQLFAIEGRARSILTAERTMLKTIGGDCDTAVGAFAEISKETLKLKAQLFSDDGKDSFNFELSGRSIDAEKIGANVGQSLLKLSRNKFKKK